MLMETGRLEEALSAAAELLSQDTSIPRVYRVIEKCRHGLAILDGEDQPVISPWDEQFHINPVVKALESQPDVFPVSCLPIVGRYLYALVRMLQPKLVVETGSYIGYSTTCMAQAIHDNGFGHIHAFDIFHTLEDFQSPVVGKCQDCEEAVRGHLKAAGLMDMVTLHKGDSAPKIREVFVRIDKSIDFAFVDGEHTCKGACGDFAAIEPHLKIGGVVAVHDTFPENGPWLGPRYLLEQLSENGWEKYGVLNLPTPDGAGFGLIQKETAETAKLVLPGLLSEIGERLRYDRLWYKK